MGRNARRHFPSDAETLFSLGFEAAPDRSRDRQRCARSTWSHEATEIKWKKLDGHLCKRNSKHRQKNPKHHSQTGQRELGPGSPYSWAIGSSPICQRSERHRASPWLAPLFLLTVHSSAEAHCRCSLSPRGASRRARDPVSRNGAFSNGCLRSCDDHVRPVLHAALFGRPSVVAPTLRVFGHARFPADLDINRISPVAGAIRNLVCDRLLASTGTCHCSKRFRSPAFGVSHS